MSISTILQRYRRFAFAWIAVSSACLGFYAFMVQPAGKELEHLRQQTESLKLEVDLTLNKTSEPALRRLSESLLRTQEAVQPFLTGPDALTSLHLQIRRWAGDHQLQNFTSHHSSDVARQVLAYAPGLAQSTLEIEFEGSFKNFAVFLNRLERADPALFIDRFSIARPWNLDDENPLNSVSMTITVLTPVDRDVIAPDADRISPVADANVIPMAADLQGRGRSQ